MRLWRFLFLVLAIVGCEGQTEIASTTKSASALARKSFTMTAFQDNEDIAAQNIDYTIKVIGPGSLLGTIFTVVNPLNDNYVPTSPWKAEELCKTLEYGGLESGWRLPTSNELEWIRSHDFTTLGFQGGPVRVEGDLWITQNPTPYPRDRDYYGDMYYSFKATMSYFSLISRLASEGGVKNFEFHSKEVTLSSERDADMAKFKNHEQDFAPQQYLCVHAPVGS